ncbi:ubiquinone/menaquinone biosynthesis C-methylase UbiE [Metabacillus crassostreae]|uniref:class I SAM-dependent methyltransferase n=1 Tax=Metabacillus crassostreae TaxID=929098 RepID=UPI001958152F|nr:class I SAM-dependent methyltransferase [Metabacillus crassostreae]MBM7602141.1 ubiquinone/menaquinone biosynthesis C-methylase UbiE [Metabacillus crassostreae]
MNYLQMLSFLGIGGAHPGGLPLTKTIFELEQIPLDAMILDVGCGTGQTTNYLYQLGFNVTGLDHDIRMIEIARKKQIDPKNEMLYLHENLVKTSIADHSYDLILCESVLSFTKLKESLPEMKRIMTKNGKMIAIEIIKSAHLTKDEESELLDFYGFSSILSKEEWQNQFKEYNFDVYKTLAPTDIVVNDAYEPSTEFNLSDDIPETTFTLLDKHEQLTNKYQTKLSYCVFFLK